MSGPAQVRSAAAIEAFLAALAKCELAVADALEGLEAQLRRSGEWVEHDRPAHWRQQTRDAQDAAQQAKAELERCLMFPVADERPACREERAALREAEERLEYCRSKAAHVRLWRQRFQHELFEYRGRVGPLRQALETDLPQARGALRRTLERLDAYRLEGPPVARELRGSAEDPAHPPAARSAGSAASEGE
jgi:hypothetical protein